MIWDLQGLSPSYRVRLLTEQDVPEVLALCQGNPLFYRHCPPFATAQSIFEDMVKLPPRTLPEDKAYIGFFDGDMLIAVMDLIRNYPEQDATFIGFFMTLASQQGNGLGSRIIAGLCAALASQGCPYIRLGWIEGNPQSQHFWRKNGFIETGVKSQQEAYTIIFAQRNLS